MDEEETAIQLILGEAAASFWKSMTLSEFADADNYRVVSEMEGAQTPYSTIFSLAELVNSRFVEQSTIISTMLYTCILKKLYFFIL